MKTIKVILLTTIFSLSFLSMTASGELDKCASKKKNTVYMSLEEAVVIPALVEAMYAQIDDNFLGGNLLGGLLHIEWVTYMGYNVYIAGTIKEWALFFRIGKDNSNSDHKEVA